MTRTAPFWQTSENRYYPQPPAQIAVRKTSRNTHFTDALQYSYMLLLYWFTTILAGRMQCRQPTH
jgi:hypothetical protein